MKYFTLFLVILATTVNFLSAQLTIDIGGMKHAQNKARLELDNLSKAYGGAGNEGKLLLGSNENHFNFFVDPTCNNDKNAVYTFTYNGLSFDPKFTKGQTFTVGSFNFTIADFYSHKSSNKYNGWVKSTKIPEIRPTPISPFNLTVGSKTFSTSMSVNYSNAIGEWKTSNHIKFIYNRINQTITAEVNAKYKYCLSSTHNYNDLNYIQFDVFSNLAHGSTVRFKNIIATVDGVVKPFTGRELVGGPGTSWHISGVDNTSGFTIEGDLELVFEHQSHDIAGKDHENHQVSGDEEDHECQNVSNLFRICAGNYEYSAPVPATQLIGFWDFDECNTDICTNVADEPYNHPGILSLGKRVDAKNMFGVDFHRIDGNRGHTLVDVGNFPEYNFEATNAFSLAAWVKFDANDFSTGYRESYGSIISKIVPVDANISRGWNLSAGNFNMLQNAGFTRGGIRFELWNGVSGPTGKKNILDISGSNNNNPNGWGDNKWHLVVATYSATVAISCDDHHGSSMDMTIYIDGVNQTDTESEHHDEDNEDCGNGAGNWESNASLRIGNTSTIGANTNFQGILDEVRVYRGYFSQTNVNELLVSYAGAVEGGSCIQTPELTDLVLDLNASEAKPIGSVLSYSNYVPMPIIQDQAYINIGDDNEDALMDDANRQPVYLESGINDKGGALFTPDFASNRYGYSDIMHSKYHKEITTDEINEWQPDPQSKTLLAVFKAGSPDMVDATGNNVYHPYYADGRQTICEFGGPLSGFNIFISPQGNICFGMWNRFERMYIQSTHAPGADPAIDDFYPIEPTDIILAHLEFDGSKKHFRALISKAGLTSNPADLTTVPTRVSRWMDFSGLSKDATTGWEDQSGIGGACRTSYYDYNTGETYSDHFNGVIGRVMLFNKYFNYADRALPNPYIEPTIRPVLQTAYDILNHQFTLNFVEPIILPEKRAEWTYFEQSNLKSDEIQLSEAYPNPMTSKSSFGINLPETGFVSVELFDAQGSKIKNIYSGTLTAGMHDFIIDGTDLNSGMYIYRVSAQKLVLSGKVILK